MNERQYWVQLNYYSHSPHMLLLINWREEKMIENRLEVEESNRQIKHCEIVIQDIKEQFSRAVIDFIKRLRLAGHSDSQIYQCLRRDYKDNKEFGDPVFLKSLFVKEELI